MGKRLYFVALRHGIFRLKIAKLITKTMGDSYLAHSDQGQRNTNLIMKPLLKKIITEDKTFIDKKVRSEYGEDNL